jgi:Flp pilus assembly protein TadB
MGDKLKILIIAMMGTLIGYTVVNLLIIPMTFWQYFGIEVIITVLHMLYETAKQREINR